MSKETQTKKEKNNQTVARNTSRVSSPLVGPIGFLLTAVYLILLSIFLVAAMVYCWAFSISDEGQLLLVVVLAGALGGQVRSLRSFAWYVGNKELKRSWLTQYILTPFVGAILATISYFIIRGCFCPANSTVQQINIYGFAGLASLVGIASEPIALKLKQVANTLFTKPIQGKDSNPQE